MSKDAVDVINLDEVLKEFDGLLDTQKLDAALGKASALVEGAARKKAQAFRDTGELARSITSKVVNHEGVIYTPVEYAPYVEFGTGLFAVDGGRQDVPWCYKDDEGNWHTTSGMKPQPYMYPALADSRAEVLRIIKEGIKND